MNSEKDTYKTISKPSKESLFKDRGSKFYGYAFPVTSEETIKTHIENLKKEHYNARHWCYAWQLGMNYDRYRVNDDGEPSNSAGAPIHGQIQAFDLTNILVVVVRYFGGTKLGVGGLIQAYKTAAKMTLEQAKIVKRTIDVLFELQFAYPEMNSVMHQIKKENIKIRNQEMELTCKIEIEVRQKEADRIFALFDEMHLVSVKKK